MSDAKHGGLREMAVKRGDLNYYVASQIKPYPGLNLRDWETEANKTRVSELAEDILVNGVQTPIEVVLGKDVDKSDNIYFTAGETRWRAVLLLEAQFRVDPDQIQFPSIKGTAKNDIDRTINLFVSNNHENFSALEIVDGFRRLESYGLTQSDIARRLGKKLHWVAMYWPLLKANHVLRKVLRDGKIAPSVAVELIRKHGADTADTMVSEALDMEQKRREDDLKVAEEALVNATQPKVVAPVENSDVAPVVVVKRRGRQPMAPGEKEAKKTLEKAKNNLDAKISGSVIMPQADKWQTPPQVTKLLAAIRYAVAWTEEEVMFNNLNSALKSVGFEVVESKRGFVMKEAA